MNFDMEPRPQNLQEFMEMNKLSIDSTEPGININCNSDEEIWIFKIPKTINPVDLKNKRLLLKKKTTIQLNNKEYEVVKEKSQNHIPCVYKDDDDVKLILINPQRTVKIIRNI